MVADDTPDRKGAVKMPTAERFVEHLLGFEGVTEDPPGSTINRFAAGAGHANGATNGQNEDAVQARFAAALAAGGTSVYEPSQQEWGAFAAQVADPDGHLWMILIPPADWAN